METPKYGVYYIRGSGRVDDTSGEKGVEKSVEKDVEKDGEKGSEEGVEKGVEKGGEKDGQKDGQKSVVGVPIDLYNAKPEQDETWWETQR